MRDLVASMLKVAQSRYGLIGTLLPGVAKFLPSNAADSAVGLWSSDANLLAPALGALLLAAWVTAFVVAGATRLQRRDIS